MAVRGISINSRRKYIPEDQRGDAQDPTVFWIGVLDPRVAAYIEDETTSYDTEGAEKPEDIKVKSRPAMRNYLRVKFGVKGIDNLIDPVTKAPVSIEQKPFKIDGEEFLAISDDVLRMLPKRYFSELAGEVINENAITDEEAKN